MTSRTPLTAADGSPLLRLVAATLAGVCLVLVLRSFVLDDLAGGHAWRQGDWLISLADGPVRRGPAGSLLLGMARLTGVPVLHLVVGVQMAVTALAGLLTLRVAWPWLGHGAVAAMLLSPAMFYLFWAGDPEGIGRKEILAYLAFALVLAARPGRPQLRWTGVLLFALSTLAHEANALLAPAFCLVLWLGAPRAPALPLAIAATAAGAFVFAVAWPTADPETLCRPLLAQGLTPAICDGAIGWLGHPPGGALAETARLRAPESLARFALIFAMALPAPLMLILSARPRRLMLAVFLGTLACELPLFLVAVDWGRWLGRQQAEMLFVALALLASGRLRLGPSRPWLAAVLIVWACLWQPYHMTGTRGPLTLLPWWPVTFYYWD